jgi:hypothetical protein
VVLDNVKLRHEIKNLEGCKCTKRGVNLPFLAPGEALNLLSSELFRSKTILAPGHLLPFFPSG